jgi:sugar O-acyltransferase (sialic acid O-acetyltransferase NeuD family)
MRDIAIVGAGGFAREVEMLIAQINDRNDRWNHIGFFDDFQHVGKSIGNSKIIGTITDLKNIDNLWIVIAIADPKTKKRIIQEIGFKCHFATLVHPDVLIGERVKIGEGTIICAGNIITTDITFGKHVTLNLGCTVGHDTVIEDFCSFMPSVNISGEVLIQESVYVGTGATIINQVEIGSNSIIGAGAVVSKSIPSNCTAVGLPAKPIKYHNE